MNEETGGELIKRISSDFESDLMRLIKTLNLISRSKEIHNSLIDDYRAIADKYKIRLNDFRIRLLEEERAGGGGMAYDEFSAPADSGHASSDTMSERGFFDEFRAMLDDFSRELEDCRHSNTGMLDTMYSAYEFELHSSQQELDSRLNALTEKFSRVPDERNVSDAGIPETGHTQTEASVIPQAVNTEERITKAPDSNSPSVSQSMLTAAGGILLGALIGVLAFYLINANREPGGITEALIGDPSQELAELEENIRPEYQTDAPEDLGDFTSISEPVEEGVSDAADRSELSGLTTPADIEETGEPGLEEASGENPGASTAAPEEYSRTAAPDADEPAELISGDDSEDAVAAASNQHADTDTDEDPDLTMYTVTGAGANVREGPGLNYTIVAVVKKGDEFPWLGKKRGVWLNIRTPAGTVGWVSGKIVRQVRR